MTVLITIAIPTYNNESTIKKAIDSCLSQTEQGCYEVLIVNNASKDGTAKVVDEYVSNPKVRVVSNLETCSLFENHNVCLREAKGRYVLFCHSDDILDSRAVEIVRKKISSRGFPESYVLWGHSLFRDFSPSLVASNFEVGELFAGIVAVKPFLLGGLTPSGTCYSKNFIDLGGFLNTNKRLTPSDSSSMVFLALNGFRFEMMQEIIFTRENASTLSRDVPSNDYLEAFNDAYKELSKKINNEVFLDLIEQAGALKMPPFHFLYFVFEVSPKSAFVSFAKHAIKRPVIMGKAIFWRVLFQGIVHNIKYK